MVSVAVLPRASTSPAGNNCKLKRWPDAVETVVIPITVFSAKAPAGMLKVKAAPSLLARTTSPPPAPRVFWAC